MHRCKGARVHGCKGAWVLGAQVLLLAIGAQVAGAQTLPPGPGADVMRARCIVCHEADLITSQRLSLTGWTREVDKMVRWGAVVGAAERDALQPYLAANFGPRPAASHTGTGTAPGPPEAILKRACLGCHEADLIEQQRLGRAGWVREVEKMMRWGATVSAAEKDPLVDHLAARFGHR